MKPLDLQRLTARPARPASLRRRTAAALLALSALAIAPLAQAETTTTAAKAAPVTIEAQALSAVAVYPQRELAASVIPRNESKLSAEVSGVLLRWTAEAGSTVKKGDVLVEIDPTDFRLAVQQAQAAVDGSAARLKQAESQQARSRVLVTQGFFSQEALVGRDTEVALKRSELASNRAQLAVAKRQLAKATLRAPFAASVMERLAQTGEVVAPGTVLYVLADTGAAEVSASIAPADVAGLRRATDVIFEMRGQSYPLRLLRIGSTVSAPARTQEVRLRFAADKASPVPTGSDGRLLWRAPQPHLPAQLLVRRGSAIGVFVRQGDVARFVALPGAQEGRAAPVSLAADTRVVVRGQATLQDGATIR
ncbi:efflux RND transporter periplasmic adaptor subunit [Accumulibacter sp.]|uniref:efflux RND transporter periplasmic adaptor subunit n=1 Tax=Accumulibacter sp. TaxID=2053492 RepID=UPI0028C45FAB|nr:efflux RND transporter periplasmic adaptor subunit [Accumulibacter sp.]